jgi:hypothetical protein
MLDATEATSFIYGIRGRARELTKLFGYRRMVCRQYKEIPIARHHVIDNGGKCHLVRQRWAELTGM